MVEHLIGCWFGRRRGSWVRLRDGKEMGLLAFGGRRVEEERRVGMRCCCCYLVGLCSV